MITKNKHSKSVDDYIKMSLIIMGAEFIAILVLLIMLYTK